MAYAERTQVPIDRTKTEIEQTLARYGAERFMYFTESGNAVIVFESDNRRLKFGLPLPIESGAKNDRVRRQRWRALFLCIKAKLEAIESGIETFEEAFLAHVVMPDGRTVHEHTSDRIALAYQGGEIGPMLPPPGSAS